tara:strand:- start:1986 stop:3110 length:1125 start_codon:yes stop_codon:yes gene_type:complete
MVFSKFLDNLTSLISSKKSKNDTKTVDSIKINELTQGMIYLQKKKEKINKLNRKIKNTEGYANNEVLENKSEQEIEVLRNLEKEYSSLLSDYGDDYRLFISEYNSSVEKVNNCKQECVTKYSSGENSNELTKSCQIGCAFKNPSISDCNNTYKKSTRTQMGCSDMLKAPNGSLRCQNGNVETASLEYVNNEDYADSNGTLLQNGCCECGGGIGGQKQKVNGKSIGSCDNILDIYESYSSSTSPGKDIIEACKAAPFTQSNISLRDKYDNLSKKNEHLKKKAQEIFNKVVILRSKYSLIDEELSESETAFDQTLKDYDELYNKVLQYKGGKKSSNIRDAQWEDVQYKEKSQSLHVLIWAGLAILTILFVLKRMKK